MKQISLNEELMNQLRLIKYDRSKTVLEQKSLSPLEDFAYTNNIPYVKNGETKEEYLQKCSGYYLGKNDIYGDTGKGLSGTFLQKLQKERTKETHINLCNKLIQMANLPSYDKTQEDLYKKIIELEDKVYELYKKGFGNPNAEREHNEFYAGLPGLEGVTTHIPGLPKGFTKFRNYNINKPRTESERIGVLKNYLSSNEYSSYLPSSEQRKKGVTEIDIYYNLLKKKGSIQVTQINDEKLCKTLKQTKFVGDEKVAFDIYKEIRYNIDAKGTDEGPLLDAIKKVTSKKIYDSLRFYINVCIPYARNAESIMQVIQLMEFSVGSERLKRWKETGNAKKEENQTSWDWFKGTNRPTYGEEFQESNDYYLYEMAKILKRYNPKEDYKRVDADTVEGFWTRQFKRNFPPYTREVLHLVIPIVSAVVSMWGGSIIASAWLRAGVSVGLEVFDALIYKMADNDDYMTGLTFIFALIPLLEVGVSALFKSNAAGILKNLAAKKYALAEFWTLEQIKVFTEVMSNIPYYKKLATYSALLLKNKLIVNALRVVKWTTSIFKKVLKLAYFVGKTLGTMVLQVGTLTITWDAIAEKIGLGCKKSFKFSDLAQFVDPSLEKPLGLLQPWTKTADECEKIKLKKLESKFNEFKKEEKNTLSLIIKSLIKMNKTFDESNSSYNINLVPLQILLFSLGMNKQSKSKPITLSLSNNIIRVVYKDQGLNWTINKVVVSPVGSLTPKNYTIKSAGTIEINQQLPLDFKNYSLFNVQIFATDNNNNEISSKKSLLNRNATLLFKNDLTEWDENKSNGGKQIKYGYFDKQTLEMVKKFQHYNNITPNGQIDQKTLKKLYDHASFGNLVIENKSGINEGEMINKIISSYGDSIIPVTDETSFEYIEKNYTVDELLEKASENDKERLIKVIELKNYEVIPEGDWVRQREILDSLENEREIKLNMF